MSDDVAVRLNASDAEALVELLEFLAEWIEFHYTRTDRSLQLFSAYSADIDELRADLVRFAVALGGEPR